MSNTLLIFLGKLISKLSSVSNLGSGSTWPGHIALTVNKNFIKQVLRDYQGKIVFVAGTNGKTTTSKLIETILKTNGKKVFVNYSGANLLNGIASSLISHATIFSHVNYDYAIFEIDENTLPLALQEITPDFLILLNLFRDQLDRYGEVNSIALKWQTAIEELNNKTILLLNADDPQIAYLGTKTPRTDSLLPPRSKRTDTSGFYFGLDTKGMNKKPADHASDSTNCPKCGTRLTFNAHAFSHLGDWSCKNCGLKRPVLDLSTSDFYPLPGVYNQYNVHAALLFAKLNNISNETIEQSLRDFTPAFGRQEVLKIKGKRVQIFLSKNPTSFNQSLRTIKDLGAKHLLLVLNDRIPDGRDVSWIWDVDFEELLPAGSIVVSGDRAYDLGLRMKYTGSSKFQISNSRLQLPSQSYGGQVKFQIEENLKKAIALSLEKTLIAETLYILPTYSAMLEVRKILTGKKIL